MTLPEDGVLQAVWWDGDAVGFIDQRALPDSVEKCRATSVAEIEEAIASLAVRGAPAIGIFGAYGVALLEQRTTDPAQRERDAARIRHARPTAVNLSWAVDRVSRAPDKLSEARAIHREQIEIDRRIGRAALELFPNHAGVVTHCNTGPLATAGEGTALGSIIAASRDGKAIHVYVDETRPLLQGSRLTMFELESAGIDATLIVDAAAAMIMQRSKIDLVIVGADRIARNGDTANKIGTYALAIAAAHHGIPFYVAAPRSTFDFTLASGQDIPIEERGEQEVLGFAGVQLAKAHSSAYNPAFDVTPSHLVTAFVTEYGIVRPPYYDALLDLESRPRLMEMSY
ncbi:MAG: S-methyl-5-thioribose-1-phosphate isomerase [Candidatus Eremiobacteraeota bacterium]|nr:S-methyl-5-thioribose-1-phosphate isomerase [Candidatus Eremiobacteraeota bacterium]